MHESIQRSCLAQQVQFGGCKTQRQKRDRSRHDPPDRRFSLRKRGLGARPARSRTATDGTHLIAGIVAVKQQVAGTSSYGRAKDARPALHRPGATRNAWAMTVQRLCHASAVDCKASNHRTRDARTGCTGKRARLARREGGDRRRSDDTTYGTRSLHPVRYSGRREHKELYP